MNAQTGVVAKAKAEALKTASAASSVTDDQAFQAVLNGEEKLKMFEKAHFTLQERVGRSFSLQEARGKVLQLLRELAQYCLGAFRNVMYGCVEIGTPCLNEIR